MRSIDSGLQAALDAGKVSDRLLIAFQFASGTYGLWTGSGQFSWNGIDFAGAGKILERAIVPQVTDGSAVPIEIRISAVPRAGVTPDVLATIEQEAYKNAPVWLYRAYFEPGTRTLITVRTIYRGAIDEIPHRYQIGGPYQLIIRCESKALDHRKKGGAMRNDAHQRLIDPDDAFFEHATTAHTITIPWGDKPSKASKAR